MREPAVVSLAELVAEFAAVSAAEAAARREAERLAAERKRLLRDLYEGRSLADVAALTGLTRARVHQLLSVAKG